MFTSAAIAQLVQAGRLTFDDKLAKVLPDYPNKEVASKQLRPRPTASSNW
jgi:CubicO group peptidase (beta-lactamase class C family)